MKVFKRHLTETLLKEVELSRIVVLTGMRQVGKTTLMKFVYENIGTENKIFLDLENPLNQKIFEENNFDNILINLGNMGLKADKKQYIFIDEIQYMPNIVKQ